MPVGDDGEPSYFVDDAENATLRSGRGSSAERGLVVPGVSATLQAKRGKGGGGLGPEESFVVNVRGRAEGAVPEVDADGLASVRAASGGSSRSYVLRAPEVATTLSAGSHPNSAIPGRKQEDDVNLVPVAGTLQGSQSKLSAEAAAGGLLVPTGGGIEQPTPALMRHGQGSGDVDFEQFVPVAETLRSHPRPGSTTPGAWALQPDDQGDTPGALRGAAISVAPTLDTTAEARSTERGVRVKAATGVRRLTPVECERLQGFPDEWTVVPGVKCPDARRYAAMGNAVTVNVAEWIGRRIVAEDAAQATLAE